MSTESTAPITQSSKKQPIVVIGLDFGTCGTGYGFKIRVSTTNEVKKNFKWPRKKINYAKGKSAILYKNGEVVSIGDEAFDDYYSTTKIDRKNFEYFELIKLQLIDITNAEEKLNKLRRTMTSDQFKEENEKIQCQKEEIITRIADYLTPIKYMVISHIADMQIVDEKDMKWVVSIPSNCQEAYAENLKMALIKAKIVPENPSDDKLSIFKESEAAGVACFIHGSFEVVDGKRYIVVDAGGGTTDITIHKVVKKQLKEEETTKGTLVGSTLLDKNFEKYIEKIIGQDQWESMKMDFVEEYHELLDDWERLKVGTVGYKKQKLRIWPELSSLLGSSSQNGKLVLDENVMKSIFEPVIHGVISFLEDSVKNATKKTTLDYMFVVGGLSQNILLRNAIKDKFSSTTEIYFPNDSGSAVIDGCVLLGCDPSLIKSRKSIYTYGMETQREFRLNEDKQEYLKYSKENGEWLCINAFEVIVQTNQDVPFDHEIVKSYDIDPSTPETRISIFNSIKPDAKYVTDPMVAEIFSINFKNDSAKCFKLKLNFGKSIVGATVTTDTGEEIPFEFRFNAK